MKKSGLFPTGLLIVAIYMYQPLCGQSDLSIMGSCGDRLVGSNMVLDWTVGEPMVSTVSTSAGMLSQGFHQPSVDTVVVTALGATLSGLISFTPNPSPGMVTLEVRDWPEALLQVLVSDARGMVVKRFDGIGAGNTAIDLTPYSAGLYNVTLYDPVANIQQLFRILKYN